tara:strand:+ start:62 stop:592 length:531 start_codon:yes stop_codon:yes gene_type:complete
MTTFQGKYFKVINNFLSIENNNKINDFLFSYDDPHPWYFVDHVNDGKEMGNYYFCIVPYQPRLNLHVEKYDPIYKPILDKLGIFKEQVDKVKFNLFPYVGNQSFRHPSHEDYPHGVGLRTCLYYVNQCKRITNFNAVKKVEAKQNRAIIFDGSIPHQSSTPVDIHAACSINIDYKY